MKAKLALPAKPKDVAYARDWVFETCQHFGCKGRRLLDVKTITSEVVTNVVKHAYRQGKKKNFSVKVKLHSNKLTIIVKDHGKGFRMNRSHSLHVGLFIVKSLADKVKIRSFILGSQVKVVLLLKESEIRKPLSRKLSFINHI